MKFKLLLVEDIAAERKVFLDSVEQFNHEFKVEFSVTECSNLDEALDILDSTFDGAVVDMKLGDIGGEGNDVLSALGDMNLRIPIVVLTGTPGEADASFAHIDVLKKGEAGNAAILEDFKQIHESGLTHVMGGKGQFEKFLNQVYKDNIMPQKAVWKAYGQNNSEQTERALMRHTLNHLIQLVDLDEEQCKPEEFYIHPSVDTRLRTGCIVVSQETKEHFVVMNPLCDLTLRAGGEFKAKDIVLAKIESLEEVFSRLPETKDPDGRKKQLEKALRGNKNGPSFHALPGTDFISEGFLNFEQIASVAKQDFDEKFGAPSSQISPAFIKDIVARFASYLGRQGQPVVSYDD